MIESAGQHKTVPKFLVHKAKINEEKQRFLNLIQKISRRKRQQRQGIIQLKNEIIQEANKISFEEQQIERNFYDAMKLKHQLQRQVKQNIDQLKDLRAGNTNSILKEVEKYSILQQAQSRNQAQVKKIESESELKQKAQSKNAI